MARLASRIRNDSFRAHGPVNSAKQNKVPEVFNGKKRKNRCSSTYRQRTQKQFIGRKTRRSSKRIARTLGRCLLQD
jgi:hypothetical protein